MDSDKDPTITINQLTKKLVAANKEANQNILSSEAKYELHVKAVLKICQYFLIKLNKELEKLIESKSVPKKYLNPYRANKEMTAANFSTKVTQKEDAAKAKMQEKLDSFIWKGSEEKKFFQFFTECIALNHADVARFQAQMKELQESLQNGLLESTMKKQQRDNSIMINLKADFNSYKKSHDESTKYSDPIKRAKAMVEDQKYLLKSNPLPHENEQKSLVHEDILYEKKKKRAELETENANLQSENERINDETMKLTTSNHELKQKLDLITEEMNMLQQKKEQLESYLIQIREESQLKIFSFNEENLKLKEEIKTLLKQLERLTRYESMSLLNSKIPYLSIEISSLMSLNSDGWRVISQNLVDSVSKLQTTKLPFISIIGAIGSGKSWLANRLSDHEGWHNSPDSISLHYANKNGGWFGILESSGWNEPIKSNDKTITNILCAKQVQTEKQNVLYCDNKLLTHLKLSYLLRYGGIIVLIISKLTQYELEKIELTKQLIRTVTKDSQPILIIVHNFSKLTKTEHCQQELIKTVHRTFQLKEEPLFNDPSKQLNDKNNSCFKDEFGIIHLITAAEETEAGEYYNEGLIRFLLSKIDTLERKQTLLFCESFTEFCSGYLSKAFHRDISLEYSFGDKIILPEKEAHITPQHILYADPSNHFYQADFMPKYSTKVEWLLGGEEARVTVDLEVLDSVIEKKVLKKELRRYYLVVMGMRRDIFGEEEKQKEKENKMILAQGTREQGVFSINIPLINGSMELKNDTQILEIGAGPGIVRIVLDFQKPQAIEI